MVIQPLKVISSQNELEKWDQVQQMSLTCPVSMDNVTLNMALLNSGLAERKYQPFQNILHQILLNFA